jgi:cysteine desulfurase
VLTAMGASPEAASSAIRISLGWRSDAADVDHLVDAWSALQGRAGEAAARIASAA